MKPLKLIIILLLISNFTYAQIEIEDKSQEPEIKTIPYSGDFMSFDGIYDQRKKAGVVGEKVTLIEISYFNIFESKEAFKNNDYIDSKEVDKFKNQTFEIINYDYDLYDRLVIKNDDGEYIWKISNSDKYVFNKFIDVTRNKLEGKTFIPLYLESEFESLDGTKFKIDGNQKYTVSKVTFAKLQFNYGIVLEINESFECVYRTGDQPTNFNGKIYTTDENVVNISSNDIFNSKVTLIEENAFDSFNLEQMVEKEGRRKELEALIGGSGIRKDFLLGNRKLLSNPKPKYNCNKEGLVIVRVEVDVQGNVIKATPGVKGSTTTSSCLMSQAKEAALKTKWKADENAPLIQIGTIKYRFSLSH